MGKLKSPQAKTKGVETSSKPKPDKNADSRPPEDKSDTIFIRNLAFDTEADTLKEFIEKNFGESVYCLVCKDKETDESKGTAFVKFKDVNNAKKCLKEFRDKEMQFKFHLDGRNLIVLSAMSRDQVQQVKKKGEKTDKRNLSLAKEGYIHPQSEEAKDMSKTDLEKRKALFVRQREQLKNLHNFISDTRLCIHNLSPNVDDQKLRNIFLHNVSKDHPNARIVECRVMRNKKGSGQLGTSKGFGFVAFSKHEHALAALRCLNNNPSIFSRDRRPIVEFSIENMVALNKKKTRLVNSQRKNKALQAKVNQQDDGSTPKNAKPRKKIDSKKMKKKSTVRVKNIGSSEQEDILKNINKLKKNKAKSKPT